MLPERFVARAVGVKAVEATPNDSLDLTICEWHGGAARVKLLVDSAPRAQLRYHNLLAEQHEFHNADPARKARQIRGVGEDSAYGGAGASDKIFKLRVNIVGFDDGAARKAAVKLTRRAVRELR